MSDTSWLYGGDAPESESLQSEREIVEDIVRTAPTITAVEVDFDTGLPVEVERALQVASGAKVATLAERVGQANPDACDNCHFEGELYFNERTGLSLCDRCDQAITRPSERDETAQGTVRWTKLRSGAWGLSGPSGTLVEGARVPVTTRSGKTTVQTVGRVLWSGDGKAIATARK